MRRPGGGPDDRVMEEVGVDVHRDFDRVPEGRYAAYGKPGEAQDFVGGPRCGFEFTHCHAKPAPPGPLCDGCNKGIHGVLQLVEKYKGFALSGQGAERIAP